MREWVGMLLLCTTMACSSDPTEADDKAGISKDQPKTAKTAKTAKTPVKKQAAAKPIAWTQIPTKTDDVAAVRKAAEAASGVRVVYIGATWCGPCKQYKAALSDPRMIKAHTGAHIIELDADKHLGSLDSLGIRPVGVPHWEMVDQTATPIGRFIDGSHWTSNTAETMAPALGKFFGLGNG